jgi:hypothetical protein
MNKKTILSFLFTSLIALTSSVFADGPLTINVDAEGCPTGVTGDGSCPAGYPGSAACRDSGARVRWITSGNAIESITKKDEQAPGKLNGCNANGPGDYQCTAVGNSGDNIDYNIKLAGCKLFDPTIIIK